MKLRRTPYLKINAFRRIFVKLRRTPFLKTCYFRRKIVKFCEIEAHFYLRTYNFRRKLVKIYEIEAHSLFENWPFSTIISENLWNSGALLIWKLAVFDENWWKSVKLRRTPYLKTGNFRRKFVKISKQSWTWDALLLWKWTIFDENSWNWGAPLVWKLAILDENGWKFVKFRRTSSLKTGHFRRNLVKLGELEAHSFFEK